MSPTLKEHWNHIYSHTPVTQLGWYEADDSPSLQMIERCTVPLQAAILDIGSGASTLIAQLLARGYANITALDISEVALEKARGVLDPGQSSRARWLAADITDPDTARQLEKVAIWHDRALFHFLTAERDRQTYHAALQRAVRPGGFVILATFALQGAEKCSGLPVQRYNAAGLSKFLGQGFKLVESLDYTYRMPSGGLRPYVYTCFQKIQGK